MLSNRSTGSFAARPLTIDAVLLGLWVRFPLQRESRSTCKVEFCGRSVVQSRPLVENDCLTENIVKHRTPVSPAVSLSLVVVFGLCLYLAAFTLLPLRS